MAEAHSAVAFSFAITHDGWDVNFDREVLYLVWESGLRSWKKRLARFRAPNSGDRTRSQRKGGRSINHYAIMIMICSLLTFHCWAKASPGVVDTVLEHRPTMLQCMLVGGPEGKLKIVYELSRG
ncbi:jg17927 [Pararge aegeria aegeria]|uniref:Jg17927 protein n=1 Tax=Pararge aegeria aegeria TaxID=348720 RepID=A0A8S4QSM5_9NEOP|nr:jg17927 [Pararge aegeria aegeria]